MNEHLHVLAGGALLFPWPADRVQFPGDYVVHFAGVFTALQGQNGVVK